MGSARQCPAGAVPGRDWGKMCERQLAAPDRLLVRRNAQLDRDPTPPPIPERLTRPGRDDGPRPQTTPNFISLIAAKSVTSPPTRFVA